MTSLILQTASKLIVPLALLFAAYMTLKGHNAPGGGFIGGLCFAVTLILLRMGVGPEVFNRMVPLHPRVLVFVGLAVAFLTGLVPLLMGYPFLTSYVTDLQLPLGASVHFASALFFDVGVLLVVVGTSVGMILRLSQEVEA